jgi:hypothetical protein
MSNTALNDMKYNFEPLKLFQPSPDYKRNAVTIKWTEEVANDER